ncbi:16913_t:CDS:10 [Entrophospora sp. SA101]|nr:16913_t:CDS:10 [Entrophospora sp. SA101]
MLHGSFEMAEANQSIFSNRHIMVTQDATDLEVIQNGDNAKEDDFDKINSNILVEDVEVGNGVFCSISTLLKVLIPFWKSGEKPVITVGDTLRNEVLKPEHQFSICLYIGKEKYETLATVCKIFDSQITSLKAHGIIDNDNIHWPVEFYFSDDWKFTSIIMSLNAPNSTYFCLYWKKNPSLFTSIELLNYVPDELRILLQITDVLMECFEMAEANQSIFSNRHIMVTQDATDLEVIQNGDNTEGIQNGDNTEEVANCSTRCETKYESFSKVCFKISWNKGCTEWNTYSTKTSSAAVSSFLQMIGWKKCSRLSGPRVFGFDIKPLHDACLQIHIKTFNTNNESCEQYTDEDDFDKINSNILVEDVEVGNGVFRSISTLLKVLIPFWKSGEKPVITVGDTLHIKLGGDGRNVGRKKNHVLLTFCLLNEGKEKYETLATVCKIFDSQITSLKAHGIIDNDNIHWPVEFYFSGDWKFASIIMGLNAPNSTYFCLYCECNSKTRYNMDLSWPITGNNKGKIIFCGKKNPSLFTSIELLNYVPDELHILLRITDFYHSNNNRSASWTWTSLMGPEKKKILQSFPVSEFVTGSHGIAIENLWCIINSTSAIPGLYRKEDVTPYMHILTMHVPFFLRKLNNQGLSFRLFSTSSIEKKNHEQVKLFFGGTTMGGGNKTKPVVYDMMIHIKTFNTNNESCEQYTDEDDFDKINSNILVEDVEVGNGVFRSISTLLKVLIPFWKSGEKPVITVGDTLRNEVLKPEHQFSICLYIGKEKYETLATVCKIFDSQITSLKAHGIIDNDNIHWPVEFYFSDDWKFTSIIMSLNAPNSTYFCLYWKKNPSLFTSIELLNYVPDELQLKKKIEKKMSHINVHFEFYHSNNNRSASWTWTSLMGPEKKKILQSFPMSEFVTGSHGIAIENLWYQFFNLYEMLRKPSYNEEDIIKFELEAKNWVRSFCQPTLGITNSTSAIPGLYRKEDVTSYMHILTMHVPFFLHKLNNQGLSFRLFSTSSIEKKIYEQVYISFLKL